VDSALYVAVYDYDWNIPNRSARRDRLRELSREFHPWGTMAPWEVSALGFIDGYSKLYGVAGIIVSKDHGATWTNLPGQGHARILRRPLRRAGLPDLRAGQHRDARRVRALRLRDLQRRELGHRRQRVPRARAQGQRDRPRRLGVLRRDRRLGHPRWTKDENGAKPIFTDPDHVGHPTITYNKGLGRFILLVSSDMVPHKEDSPPEVVDRWNLESEMQLYEGPTPWGPWSIFHDEVRWGGDDHTHYLPQMPASWLGADGLSGSLLFAGDYVKRKAEHYGFMTQQFRLVRK
jgi:hypothetical protein